MTRQPNVLCTHQGCPALIPYGEKYCDQHKPLHAKDRRSSAERGYDGRWQKARKRFLAAHPWCVRCRDKGQLVPATMVDHIRPDRGDSDLFWNEKNWQPLCKSCHDHKTMTEDRDIKYKYYTSTLICCNANN